MLAWLALLLLAGALSVPLVHEAGHALLAVLVGGRRVRLERRRWLQFATSTELPGGAWPRRLFYAGGPLANALAAVALWCVVDSVAVPSALVVMALGVALAHLGFALVNLLPLVGYDGHALFVAATEPREGEPPEES